MARLAKVSSEPGGLVALAGGLFGPAMASLSHVEKLIYQNLWYTASGCHENRQQVAASRLAP